MKKSTFVLGMALALSVPLNIYAGVMETNAVQAVQQQSQIKGTVVDENGEPLIGVTVQVKGTQGGAITDFDGNYTINAGPNDMLTFSYVGYVSQTVKASQASKVQMKPDAVGLDDVVVIGYGTQKKRDLTGAITSVKAEDITLNPGPNPMDALQGKVAGLDITRSSGQAGATPAIQLRGTRSFDASGTPTYIIDGMPGDINTINPNDIESIEVLKDASSTAIYGASGANGIIIVTTKSGKEGKAKVNFNTYLGVNGWSSVPKVYDAQGIYNLRRQAQIEAASGMENDVATILGGAYSTFATAQAANPNLTLENWLAGNSLDWADKLLKTGITQNYSISVSGGTEKTKAYMSLNFANENGQYENDNYKVYSTNIRVDHKVNKWLATGINLQGSYTYKNSAYENLNKALTQSPIGQFYNENGEVNVTPVAGGTLTSLLVNNKSNYRNNTQATEIYLNPYIRITPLKGLTWESRINASLTFNKNNRFEGIGSYKYYEDGGKTGTTSSVYGSVAQTNQTNYKWENILTYNFKIADVHDITLTGVTSWNHNRREYTYSYGSNLTTNTYLWHNLDENGSNTANTYAKTSYTMSKGMGYVGRINYSYLGRYLASVSVRHDGSSRLATGNQWDTFPAFSLGWRVSDEAFMESTKSWLDNLKVRLGYGVTGTASIDPYSSITSFLPGKTMLGNTFVPTTVLNQNIANLDLGWEKSKSWNIGFDAAFLGGRIDFTADYYITNTEGVIWSKELPITNGGYTATSYYTTRMNICETLNRGIELAVTGRPFVAAKPGDFSWTINGTFSANHEEIKKLATDDMEWIANGGSGHVLYKGEPVNSFFHYKLDGTWTLDEAADAAVFGQKPGDLKISVPNLIHDGPGQYSKWEDVEDENGVVTNQLVKYDKDNVYTITEGRDFTVLGHKSPSWTAGLKNTFNYKNFDLSIYMYWRYGQMIQYELLGAYNPSGGGNFPTYFDYYTAETGHSSHYFPALNANQKLENVTGWYALPFVDGSFFKIKNITLGYTLPTAIGKKIGIENLRVYGTITNPLVVAKSNLLKDYDPEMGGSLSYPLTKQLVFGVNLTF